MAQDSLLVDTLSIVKNDLKEFIKIHYRIDLIDRQLKWYSSHKQLAEKLVKKINQETQYIETIY